jgi:cellobiose-specific phosphotransferase system component IIC
MNKKTMLIVGIIAVIGIAYYMKKKRKVISADAVIPTTETTIIKTEKMTNCPSKEVLAKSRYTKEAMDKLKAQGCV